MMDDLSAEVVEHGGMPTGDDAERACAYYRTTMEKARALAIQMGLIQRPEQIAEQDNIYRCLIAFLAVMRMSESKREKEDCGCPEGAEEQCVDILCPRKEAH